MKTKELLAQLKAAQANLKTYKAKRLAAANGGAQSEGIAAQEKIASRKFGVKSLNDLIKINTSDRRYKAIPKEDREAVRNLKEAVDVTLMCAKVFGKSASQTKAYSDMVEPALKALGIESGDDGALWIPTMVSESYIDEYNLERKVAGLFTELKMPSNPYEFPVLNNGAVATKLGQNSEKGTKDVFAATKITLTAVKLSNQYELPEELSEDSAVDVMKVIRQELIEGQEKAMEIAILEGDTETVHQHSNSFFGAGAPAADSSERVFDGLRKRALAAELKVDGEGAAPTEAKLGETRKKLGKFGINPAELALIVGVRGSQDMLQLDDVRTLETYGPQATVVAGEIGKYEGVKIICSEYLREDCDEDGVNSSTDDELGSMIYVNTKRWYTGLRRNIICRVENNRTSFDVWDMVSFSRRAFDGVLKADGSNAEGAFGEKSVAILYNLA